MPDELLTSYGDVYEALTHGGLGRDGSEFGRSLSNPAAPVWSRLVGASFMELDPPAHTAPRRESARRFGASALERVRPMIEAEVERALPTHGTFDVVATLGDLPARVIAVLLGADDAPVDHLVGLSHRVVAPFGPSPDDDVWDDAEEAAVELADLLGDWLPDEDLGTAILLFNAGHEATALAIGNAVRALAEAPSQFNLLRSGAISAADAVDELLRFDPPLDQFHRWVKQPVRSGWSVGTQLWVSLASANRDPGEFIEPDVLDLARPDARRHLAFGAGVHRCVGAPLARLELTIVIERLVQKYESITVVDASRRQSPVFRGHETLVIAAQASPRR